MSVAHPQYSAVSEHDTIRILHIVEVEGAGDWAHDTSDLAHILKHGFH